MSLKAARVQVWEPGLLGFELASQSHDTFDINDAEWWGDHEILLAVDK